MSDTPIYVTVQQPQSINVVVQQQANPIVVATSLGLQGMPGPTGPQGPSGSQGPQGNPASGSISSSYATTSSYASFAANVPVTASYALAAFSASYAPGTSLAITDARYFPITGGIVQGNVSASNLTIAGSGSVAGDLTASANLAAKKIFINSSPLNNVSLFVNATSASNAIATFTDNANATARIRAPFNGCVSFGGNNAHNILFGGADGETAPFTEWMRIQASTGRVGIGTTNPQNPLHIIGDATIAGAVTQSGTTLSSAATPLLLSNTNPEIRLINGGVLSFSTTGKQPVNIDMAASHNTMLVNGTGVTVTSLFANYVSGSTISSENYVFGHDANTSGWTSAPIRPGQPLGNANNANGLDLVIQAGQGTGNGAFGSIQFQTAAATGSGTQGYPPMSSSMTLYGPNGGLGIGTTTPNAKLHVVGNTQFDIGVSSFATGSVNQPTIRFTTDLSNGAAGIYGDRNQIIFATAGNPRLTIDSSGRLKAGNNYLGASNSGGTILGGIADGNASANLIDIFTQDGSGWFGNYISFRADSGATRFAVDTSGSVGIRVATPKEALHVSGNILALGFVSASTFYGDGSHLTGIVSPSTSSLAVSASYATTSSYALVAQSVLGSISNAVSASYALSASWAPANPNATSASFASNALTANSAVSASYALTASFASNAGISQGTADGRYVSKNGDTVNGNLNVVGDITGSNINITNQLSTDINGTSVNNALKVRPNGLAQQPAFEVATEQITFRDITSLDQRPLYLLPGYETNTTASFYTHPTPNKAISGISFQTPNPTAGFDAGPIIFDAGSASFSGQPGGISFQEGSQEYVRFINGRVGIGTHTPLTPLHVVGTVSASAFAGDGSQVTGVITAATASYVAGANVRGSVVSASFASNALTANSATTASYATVAQSVLNTPVSASYAVTASAATSITFLPSSASFAQNALTANSATSASFASSGFGSFIGSISGSHTGSFTGSLLGNTATATTASYATVAQSVINNPVSASFATTASAAASITFLPPSASFAQNALTANSVTSASFASSGLGTFSGTHVGSFTGSVSITGSALLTGSLLGNAATATSASYALSASWAPGIVSSSYAVTASAATSITFLPSSASFAQNALTANSVTSASYALSASWAPSAGGGITQGQGDARYWLRAGDNITGSFNVTGSFTSSFFKGDGSQVTGVVSSSYALTSSYINTGGVRDGTRYLRDDMTFQLVATASYAPTASYGFTAVTSSYAATAVTASYYLNPRGNVVQTTVSLANLATETGSVDLGKSFALLQVSTDRACRIRLYATTGSRAADSLRVSGSSVNAGMGVIMELNPTGSNTIPMTPMVWGQNLEGTPVTTIPYYIQNTSGGTSTVQVTFTRLRIE